MSGKQQQLGYLGNAWQCMLEVPHVFAEGAGQLSLDTQGDAATSVLAGDA